MTHPHPVTPPTRQECIDAAGEVLARAFERRDYYYPNTSDYLRDHFANAATADWEAAEASLVAIGWLPAAPPANQAERTS